MLSLLKVTFISFSLIVTVLFVYLKIMYHHKERNNNVNNNNNNNKYNNVKDINSVISLLKEDSHASVKTGDTIVKENVRKVCPSGSREPSVHKDAINKLFTRVTTLSKFKKYTPVIHNSDPWVVTFDTFLTDEEADMVIQMSQGHFSPSALAGAEQINQNYRRSESFGCDHHNKCIEHESIKPIIDRMHEVTDINMKHTEDLTVTHYNIGGFYGRHHDYILEESMPKSWKNCGPRTFTFLVYLNDVEEGGETKFFHLDLKQQEVAVKPKKGRAILWPNTFNDNPFEKDERTAHEALKVLKGEKYILQTWFYMYDYASNIDNNCCG